MIQAELRLHFRRDALVVILPNMIAGRPIDGLDNLLDATSRPVKVLRVNDVVEDCELVDWGTGDRFNVPEGARWKVKGLEVQPAVVDYPERVYTLVQVP